MDRSEGLKLTVQLRVGGVVEGGLVPPLPPLEHVRQFIL